MPRAEFIAHASTTAIRKASYLSESLQKNDMIDLVDRVLCNSSISGECVSLSPEALAAHIKKHLDAIYRSIPPKYIANKTTRDIPLYGIKIRVPDGMDSTPEHSIGGEADWKKIKGGRNLLSGWTRCVHKAVPFGVYHELIVARCIDRCKDVKWWFRNLPAILALDTPAGRYSPDFAVFVTLNKVSILLEVKGDIYAESSSSTASVKKHAAELWCEAVSKATNKPWEYWFLLDSDAAKCSTWDDITKLADRA